MDVAPKKAPNLKFSHMGLSVRDIARMEAFYVGVLGFTVTDRGDAGGMQLVFLSRDPLDHHQVVLGSGRPAHMPDNAANPFFGPSINQISFKVGCLDDLRDIFAALKDAGLKDFFPANHGVAWSIYAHDPEGNTLEFFVETDWYITQPLLNPLDLTRTDEDIRAETLKFCEVSEGFQLYSDWRAAIAPKMTRYIDRAVAG